MQDLPDWSVGSRIDVHCEYDILTDDAPWPFLVRPLCWQIAEGLLEWGWGGWLISRRLVNKQLCKIEPMHVLYIHLFSSLCFFLGRGHQWKNVCPGYILRPFPVWEKPPTHHGCPSVILAYKWRQKAPEFFCTNGNINTAKEEARESIPRPAKGGGRSLITPTVIQPRQPRLEWSLTNVLPISIFYIFAH